MIELDRYFILLDGRTFYQFLDIETTASDTQISYAVKQAYLKYHPDKGPPSEIKWRTEMTQLIGYINKILLNQETREIYDQYGFIGLKRHEQSGGFSNFVSKMHERFRTNPRASSAKGSNSNLSTVSDSAVDPPNPNSTSNEEHQPGSADVKVYWYEWLLFGVTCCACCLCCCNCCGKAHFFDDDD
ncbi:hypothetical protein M3Y97_01106500 [Aphelenchoides bicaudatus]|nr:hypothetical protein M3Y97_01106500 [Aphelenchoides bicaudatus]